MDRGAVGRPSWAAASPASTRTSSPTAAARWPPPSSSPRCGVRYPTITVADIYATPRIGALIDAARQSLPDGVAGGPAPERPVRPTALKSQVFQTLMGIPLHILVGHALADLPDGRQQPAVRALPASRPRPRCPGGGWRASWLVFVSPAGRMAHLGCRRPPPAAQRAARDLPAVRQGSPAAVAGRTDPGPLRRHQPRQRTVGALLRAGPRREDRRDVHLHSLPAGDRACSPWAAAATSSPKWTCPGGGSTATSSASAHVHVGAGATVGARSTLMPGASIGAGRPGGAGLGRAGQGQGRPAGGRVPRRAPGQGQARLAGRRRRQSARSAGSGSRPSPPRPPSWR